MYKKISQTKIYGIFFLIGVIIGTILFIFIIENNSNLSIEDIKRYHVMIRDSFTPSLYNFMKVFIFRMETVICLLIFSRLTGSLLIFYPMTIVVGSAFGYTLGMLTNCYGIIGIVVMLFYLFPHGFMYSAMFLFVSKKIISQKTSMFYGKLGGYVVLFIALIVACLAESVVNPMFLKIFFKKIL